MGWERPSILGQPAVQIHLLGARAHEDVTDEPGVHVEGVCRLVNPGDDLVQKDLGLASSYALPSMAHLGVAGTLSRFSFRPLPFSQRRKVELRSINALETNGHLAPVDDWLLAICAPSNTRVRRKGTLDGSELNSTLLAFTVTDAVPASDPNAGQNWERAIRSRHPEKPLEHVDRPASFRHCRRLPASLRLAAYRTYARAVTASTNTCPYSAPAGRPTLSLRFLSGLAWPARFGLDSRLASDPIFDGPWHPIGHRYTSISVHTPKASDLLG